MNVKQLREMLAQYPDDMEILNERFSDYDVVKLEDWAVIDGVPNGQWVMRAHATMSDENKAKVRKYLHLAGN